MDIPEIDSRIKSRIAEQFGLEVAELESTTNFMTDLHVDSLDTVELIIMLEDEFECVVRDEEAEALMTIGAVVDYISKKVNEPK